MISSGTIGMPLHFGRMPAWFTENMGNLTKAVFESVIQHYGKSELLTRLSDPNWLQAVGSVAGFQYNSSGVTAALFGSVRPKINPMAKELGVYILGGKGKRAWAGPQQITRVADQHGLDGTALVRAFQLGRRVDNNAIQDGFNIYQQHFILSDEGEWTGITQGMDTSTRRARRYHMRSSTVRSFVEDPHTAIVGDRGGKIINLADARADKSRSQILELTQSDPKEVIGAVRSIEMGDYHDIKKADVDLKKLGAVLAMSHGKGVEDFEDLLLLKGVGPRTLRALALASELIHGDSSRFEDPARFSFASGGKDGRPFPVEKEALSETIQHLQDSVEQAKLGYSEKSKALKRLHRATRHIEDTRAPEADVEAYADSEWDHAEKSGGLTFMGTVIPVLTKAAVSLQNSLLYPKRSGQSR